VIEASTGMHEHAHETGGPRRLAKFGNASVRLPPAAEIHSSATGTKSRT